MISNRYRNDGKAALYLNANQKKALTRVISRINSGEYRLVEFKCDCGAGIDDSEVISEKDRYGIAVQTRICKKCGLVMTNPNMDQPSLNRFYDKDYRDLYVGKKQSDEEYYHKQIVHGLAQLNFFQKEGVETGSIKSILDIGCGAGGILSVFVDRFPDAKCVGIDLGGEYLKYGVERGLDLRNVSSAELQKNDKQKYDLIICSHSLEHFLNLSMELDTIRSLLAENGYLYIEVPGLKYIPKVYKDTLKYIQSAHIRSFDLDTLCQVMNRNHFKLIRGNEVIQSVFQVCDELSTDYQDNTVNYYTDIITFLKEYERHNKFNIYVRNPLSKNRVLVGIWNKLKNKNKSDWQES